MKKILIGAAAVIALASCTSHSGNVTIRLPKDFAGDTLIVSHVILENSFSAKTADDVKIIYDTLMVKNGEAMMELDPAGAAWYNIQPPVMTRQQPEFYATPDDKLSVVIAEFDPLDFEVKGSELMEDLTAYAAVVRPIQQEYTAMVNSGENITEAQAKAIMDRFDAAIKQFVNEHPKSPAVPYIILELSGDDFKEYYDNLTPEAKKSILMPYAEANNREVEKMLQARADEQARKDEVASGTITAPGFTLPDLNGKNVSLSDFRGKWVVLDFWGSWCGWCIKGFPALKEAYAKYGDKIVVIGIDCNESEADWRAGVKKYQLPWINVYNGYGQELYKAYNIDGFPTKAIINPEGKLVNLTKGEDPSFFTALASFVE